jgi:hypothetical protein
MISCYQVFLFIPNFELLKTLMNFFETRQII